MSLIHRKGSTGSPDERKDSRTNLFRTNEHSMTSVAVGTSSSSDTRTTEQSHDTTNNPLLFIDDADAAAGQERQRLLEKQLYGDHSNDTIDSHYRHHHHPSSSSKTLSQLDSMNGQMMEILPSEPPSSANASLAGAQSDLEFFEDMVSDPVIVLGYDITHLPRQVQFIICASGVFFFSLLYGYLQELISVELMGRKLGLFLASVQFSGYTFLAYFVKQFVYEKEQRKKQKGVAPNLLLPPGSASSSLPILGASSTTAAIVVVPFNLYLGLSLLRAVDLGMTNLAMQYINYPAKTLMKSSRIVFTMLFGVVLARKKYQLVDYGIVAMMVVGLALFMHADANSSAVFSPVGVIMLTVSLVCDGAISNMSESIMSNFGVGQDEFIFRMYSIALVAITIAAAVKGDMREGITWMMQPGTYDELSLPIEERTWSSSGKIVCLILFSSMGFFGSSCSAAITKNFGALTMSITSTARKATTLFLSFFLFHNVCTIEHVGGIVIFITALTAKSLRRRKDKTKKKSKRHRRKKKAGIELPFRNGTDSETCSLLGSEHGVPSTSNTSGNSREPPVVVDMVTSQPSHDSRLVMRRALSSEASDTSIERNHSPYPSTMRHSVHIV